VVAYRKPYLSWFAQRSHFVKPREITTSHILVTDDDRAVSSLLRHLLEGAGHRVTVARDGYEALAAADADPADLFVLDVDMPNLGGFEVCRRLRQNPATRLVPILVLTGREPTDSRLRAWELGADDFLTKPFVNIDVLARCQSLLRVRRLINELDSAEAVVFAFAAAVDAKCPYTRGHSERVTQYALRLAEQAGLPAHDREVLRRGAQLHDLGKIGIPDAILNKPGPLTAAEYEVVKKHPEQGERILKSLRSVRAAMPLVRSHHERLDGRGYPDGLRGDAIALPVRILSVADVYDALTSARPYRAAMSHDRALAMLRENAFDGGLDPELVHVFGEAVPGRGPSVEIPDPSAILAAP
jgi:putative two-component system response regulator